MVKTSENAIGEKDLRRWRLIEEFRQRLEEAASEHPPGTSWQDPRRRAELADYLSLFLFALLNPVLKTMRGACAASRLGRVQREVCGAPLSLGSFSEAQALVDPQLLQNVFSRLWADNQPQAKGPLAGALIVDSTLWQVLPRMAWAVWRHQYQTQRAARLHVKFHLLGGQVAQMQLHHANVCERKQWRAWAQPGEFHVGDRNFGEDYQLLAWMEANRSEYLVRLRQDAQWIEEQVLPLSQADGLAGVLWQGWVRLGKHGAGPRTRLVRVLGEEEQLFLVTNVRAEVLSGELISQLYRYRWQVELFFRWLKCIFGCRHWLAESQSGMALQVYLALIAAQLMYFYRGALPNKRQLELIQMYLSGWASGDELMDGLDRFSPRAKTKN